MKKITNIGGALIIAITLSFPFVYLGSILALGGVYVILTLIFWYVFLPLIFIFSIYLGYRNSKSENPSKIFRWVVRICSLILLAYIIWWASFIVQNLTPPNQRPGVNDNIPTISTGGISNMKV